MDFYTVLIFVTLIGFGILAFMLLWPVYQFLDREQEVSKQWTEEALAKRLREQQASSNGAPDAEAPPSEAEASTETNAPPDQ